MDRNITMPMDKVEAVCWRRDGITSSPVRLGSASSVSRKLPRATACANSCVVPRLSLRPLGHVERGTQQLRHGGGAQQRLRTSTDGIVTVPATVCQNREMAACRRWRWRSDVDGRSSMNVDRACVRGIRRSTERGRWPRVKFTHDQ